MKRILKPVMNALACLLVSPFYALMLVGEVVLTTDQPFQSCSQFLSLMPGIIGNYLRRGFYMLALKKCSNDCCIEFGTILNQRTIEIGRRVYIGTNCCIGECKIEDDVLIGSNVDIISGKKQHFYVRTDIAIREQGGKLETIVIGEDSWICNSSVVMANVGTKSIIGAGSVVVDDIEPFSIAAGNPAKVIKKRAPEGNKD